MQQTDNTAPAEIADAIRLGSLEQLAGYQLRRSFAVLSADFTRAMVGTGMRQVLVGILSIIAANPDINQGTIGRALGIQRANMVSLMNELLDNGLVERSVSPTDRRAFTFTLTNKGEFALADALTRIREHERQLLSGLSPAERMVLLDLLSRIGMRSK